MIAKGTRMFMKTTAVEGSAFVSLRVASGRNSICYAEGCASLGAAFLILLNWFDAPVCVE